MAYLALDNGQKRSIPRDEALKIWGVLNGGVDPTPEQEKFCSHIKDIWLNWRKAPDSYIAQRLDRISQLHLNGWLVDCDGVPVKPGDDSSWVFAKKWGLWDGGLTQRAKNYIRLYK